MFSKADDLCELAPFFLFLSMVFQGQVSEKVSALVQVLSKQKKKEIV